MCGTLPTGLCDYNGILSDRLARRMKRQLLNVLTALSLLLCVAVCVLWVRSRFVADSYSTARTVVGSMNGGVVAMRGYGTALAVDPHERGYRSLSPEDAALGLAMATSSGTRRSWAVGGFGYALTSAPGGGTRTVMVPYWAMLLLLGALPAARGWHYARRGPRSGLCPQCGYDLRATPGRCPECGTLRGPNITPLAHSIQAKIASVMGRPAQSGGRFQ